MPTANKRQRKINNINRKRLVKRFKKRFNNRKGLRFLNGRLEMPPRFRTIIVTSVILDLAFPSNDAPVVIYPTDLNEVFSGFSTVVSDFYLKLMNFYSRFVVLASKIQVEYMHAANSTASGMWAVIVPTLETSTFTGIAEDASINRKARRLVLGTPGGLGVKTLTNFSTSFNMFGVNPMFDQDYSGSLGSAPTKLWQWGLANTITTTGQHVFLNIRVFSHTLFYDRITLNMQAATPRIRFVPVPVQEVTPDDEKIEILT